MKKALMLAAILALCLGLSGVAKADACIPAASNCTAHGGVQWTFTSGGAESAGVFDLVITVDTTGATASGTLSLFSFQYGGATNAVLESTSSNATGWSVAGFGNVNHCGSGNLPFICSMGNPITVTSGGPGAVYTFTFDVFAPSASTAGDIQAFQHNGGGLAISNPVGIGTSPPPSVPEPASLTLLGLGLVGVPFLRRRRS